MIALFFDTETTGIPMSDPHLPQPEIVQIAAVQQDTETKRVLAEINFLVKPIGAIPEEVTNIHGISTELARKYGQSQNSAEAIFITFLLTTERLVAHNIKFDIDMIRLNWPTAFELLDESIPQYDTMRESADIVGLPPGVYHGEGYMDHKPPKLAEAYKFFMDEDIQNAHDAMADVRACRDVYFKIQDHNHQ